MKNTIARYRNTIKENESTIQSIRFAPPSENQPLGGIDVRAASYRFERRGYSENKEREFEALYDYCTEEKTLPDIDVKYKGFKIGELLNCIIKDKGSCTNNRREWLYK